MPQIGVPFLPGDKVRVKDGTGTIYTVDHLNVRSTTTVVWARHGYDVVPFRAASLEAVKPVIGWRRNYMDDGWNAPGWLVGDDGTLLHRGRLVGTFPAPRAVAEETQTLWNERAKGQK